MGIKIRLCLMAALILSIGSLKAQDHLEVSASEILHDIKGLKTVGSALYLAAHPDDENTKVISYLANHMQLKTSYLALTRGDGGQNLIGTEISEALGVVRTQELLKARSIDGGTQYFTRAVDFGYSKNPTETFDKWQRDEVLKDVVWVIREVRPDIIITRFPPDERAGHGHHTASAMLAIEALKQANNPKFKFNDSRDGKREPWKVHRVVWNTSIWWFKRYGVDINENELYKIDVGGYNPLLGESYNSIASKARSSHRSQGFGDIIDRGNYPEYFQHLTGDSAKNNIFEDLDFTWERFGAYNMAQKADKLITQIAEGFKVNHPEKSIDDLIRLKKFVKDINDQNWQNNLTQRIDEIIAQCAGLYFEVLVDRYYACDGDSVTFSLNAVKRNNCLVKTKFIDFGEFTYHIEEPTELNDNVYTQVVSRKIKIDAAEYGYSNPYWLEKPQKNGMWDIENRELIGLAEKRPFQNATALFEVNDETIEIKVPISYKWEDRALGELRRPFEIRPKVSINFDQDVLVAQAGKSVQVDVSLIANTENASGKFTLIAPSGWQIVPNTINFASEYRGEVVPYTFTLTPSKTAKSGELNAQVNEESGTYTQSLIEIEHDHIPSQVMMPKAKCKLVYVDVATNNQKVAYLMGAGDEVPNALEQLGYQVDLLDPENITMALLNKYETVMVGVRAYNTIDNIMNIHNLLMEYVKEGGKVISQYNTSYALKNKQVGPFGLEPARARITDENAPLSILEPKHPIFNSPNKISTKDFDNWVQERGLYFPTEFPEEYTPLLEGNDKDEEPLNGMLLVTEYGKGQFVYTTLSFFRELPAGVPGAYRLMVNLVEY
ncbi:MAG: PIG-L family deacetylase [Bacteroidia bacterium]